MMMLCKDCKYCKPGLSYLSRPILFSKAIPVPDYSYAECRMPANLKTDLVTGEYYYLKTYCNDERLSDGKCKLEALYFTPREVLDNVRS
jgi:hypothetical protein